MNPFPRSVLQRAGTPRVWAVALAALIGALLGIVFTAGQSDRFTAETVVAIAPADAVVDQAQLVDIVGSMSRSGIPATAAGLGASRSVAEAAAATLSMPADEFADYDVDAVPVIDANLVDISVSGPDADRSAALANAVAAEVERQFAELYRVYQVRVVTAAAPPGGTDRPSPLLVVLGAALVAGLGAAFLVNRGRTHAPGVHAVSA
jgi:capsular polysaccharide biosynthesis protein